MLHGKRGTRNLLSFFLFQHINNSEVDCLQLVSLLGTFTLLEVVGWVCDPLVCMAVKCLYFGFLWKISHLSTCLLYLKYYVLFPILKKLVYSGGIQYHLSNGMQIQLLKSTGLWRRYECLCVCVCKYAHIFFLMRNYTCII